MMVTQAPHVWHGEAHGTSRQADDMKHYWDGFLSLLAGLATAAICGVPSWYTYQAIVAGVAPDWAYASVALLAGMGAILTFAFLRKARGGISPTRDRKRR